MKKEQQLEVFRQGKSIDPRDTTAHVFLGSVSKDPSSGVFEQGISLEGLSARVLQQKEAMLYGPPMHQSAIDFVGNGPDPRDHTAIDFIGSYNE